MDVTNSFATVYKIGNYFDKAGTGYIVEQTDTLSRQIDGAYLGKQTKIIFEGNRCYLLTQSKKAKRVPLDTVKSLNVVNNKLNNAYYLERYFRMSDELNKSYSLNHHTFRNGFYTWEKLQNKEIDYLQFREFATFRLKQIKDSISKVQDRHTAVTNFLVRNVQTMDYNILKDSLMKLPAQYKNSSWYYGTVINEVAMKRPEYFFRIAEDFPNNRSLIFNAVYDNKEAILVLKEVEGYDEIKKKFFKDIRFGKTLPYRIFGTYAVIGGLLTWLIVSQ